MRVTQVMQVQLRREDTLLAWRIAEDGRLAAAVAARLEKRRLHKRMRDARYRERVRKASLFVTLEQLEDPSFNLALATRRQSSRRPAESRCSLPCA